MIVHQIWVGGKMPQKEAAWCATVRAAAAASGWEYRLWTWEALRTRYAAEDGTRTLAIIRDLLPVARWASLLTDYYRFRLCGDSPGLYLDTDTEATTPSLPDFPHVPGLYTGSELSWPDRANTCALLSVGDDGSTVAKQAADAAGRHLVDIFDPYTPGGLAERVQRATGRRWALVWLIGPAWFRRMGFPHAILPHSVASSCTSHAALFHRSSGSWCKKATSSGTEALDGPGEVARAMQAQRDSCPPWLRAQGGVAVTRPTASAPAETAQEASQAAADSTAARHFSLPDWVRRVVVFSNVAAERVPMAPLGLNEGDLCIHIGSCKRHAEAVATAAREHWCVVRHGSGFRWYTPPTFNGFRRVVFVDSVLSLSPFAWFRAYKEANKDKSPTTGFLVANIVRELRPDMPLVLAGFAPGTPCGTPLWSGHAWDFERYWYEAHGFDLRSPNSSPNK